MIRFTAVETPANFTLQIIENLFFSRVEDFRAKTPG